MLSVFEIKIASGQPNSVSVDLSKLQRVFGGPGIGSYQLPATMTGATTAVQVSNDNTNWTACPVDSNSEETPQDPTAANGSYILPRQVFGFRYFRLVSGSNEAADRLVKVYLRT